MKTLLRVIAALSILAMVACASPQPTPTQPPIPTATRAAPIPTLTPTATAVPSGTPRPRLFVVVRLDPPNVRSGARITALADTLPESLCAIHVTDPLGKTLFVTPPTKVADADGRLTWSWTVPKGGADTSTWRASVECILSGVKASASEPFKVYGG